MSLILNKVLGLALVFSHQAVTEQVVLIIGNKKKNAKNRCFKMFSIWFSYHKERSGIDITL